MLRKVPRLGADVVLVDLKIAVEQDDGERAHEPIIAAMRELGWSGCLGRRASMASLGTGAAASSSR
jgi:citrate lyase beta subunit